MGGGKQGFLTLTNIPQDVTLPSKPHRAIYPRLERRTEKGHSATDVKPKIDVYSGATSFRDLSGKTLKNAQRRNER